MHFQTWHPPLCVLPHIKEYYEHECHNVFNFAIRRIFLGCGLLTTKVSMIWSLIFFPGLSWVSNLDPLAPKAQIWVFARIGLLCPSTFIFQVEEQQSLISKHWNLFCVLSCVLQSFKIILVLLSAASKAKGGRVQKHTGGSKIENCKQYWTSNHKISRTAEGIILGLHIMTWVAIRYSSRYGHSNTVQTFLD